MKESLRKNFIRKPLKNIIVRNFKKNDINRLIEIMNGHTYSNDINPNREMLERSLYEKNHKIFIAENCGKVIGFFDVRYYEDWLISSFSVHIEHMFMSLEKNKKGEYLYLLRGVGSKLMEEVIKYFKKYLNKYECLHFYTEGRISRFMLKNNFVITKQNFYKKKIKRKKED